MKNVKTIINDLFIQARDNDNNHKMKMVAMITIKGKLISYGYNDGLKTHPFQKEYSDSDHKIYWHAENNAIYNALKFVDEKDLKKATLYVVRAKKKTINHKYSIDMLGLAKPCDGCMKAIRHFGIKTVIYSCDAEFENETHYSVIEGN